MFGGLMGPSGPTADAQPADLESKWLQTLQSPETQRMLLTFGTQLMAPRWSGASALPDAINAVGRNEAALEKEDYNREKAETDRQTKIDINNADNTAAMARTRVAADNRAEVANIRGEYGLQIQNSRENFRRELLTAKKTPDEERFWQNVYLEKEKDILSNRGTPEQRQRAAQQAADDALSARRLRFGSAGQPGQGNAGQIISTNPAAPSGQQGQAKPGEAGKITSTNPSGQQKYSTSDALKRLKEQGALDALLAQPDAYEQLAPIVTDPDYLRKYLELIKKGK